MPRETLLTTKQIAERIGVHERTVVRYFHADRLRGAYQCGGDGGMIRMPEKALEKLLKRWTRRK